MTEIQESRRLRVYRNQDGSTIRHLATATLKETAYIHPTVQLPDAFVVCSQRNQRTTIGEGVIIGETAHIGEGVEIGDNCHIGRGVILEDRVKLGSGTIVERGAAIGARTILEENVIVREGATIGPSITISKGVEILPRTKIVRHDYRPPAKKQQR